MGSRFPACRQAGIPSTPTKKATNGGLLQYMYTVYILESISSGRFYKGQTNDLLRRLKEHNNGEEKSTAAYVPWVLVWSANVPTRSEALILERKIKNITGVQRLREFIAKHR